MLHIINNADQIRRDLIQILIDDVVACCDYQRDVYMYVDADDNAELELFANIGGNSWCDDGHYCLAVLHEHTDRITDNFETAADLADALDMTEHELRQRTLDYFDRDDNSDLDDVDLCDMCKYAETEHADQLTVWMREICVETRSNFAELADHIIDTFNARQLATAQNTAELMELPIDQVDYIEL